MVDVQDLVGALDLETTGPDRYRARHVVANGYGVVFGGQLLAQALVAGLTGHDGKRAKTLHTIFARGASPEVPLDIAVDTMHAGRAFASTTVTISQGDRLCTRSLLLLTAEEPDLIRHADPAPAVAAPDDDRADGPAEWEVRVVDDVDISDPELTGPPDLDVWTRFPGAPDDPTIAQALLAFATDGFLIGTAMRPHPGVGQAQAHVTLTTGVISHTITFHEPFAARDWLLLAHHSPYAGRGRSYGRADVFRPDGALVASYVQDAMIRAKDSARPGAL
ncbi:MAG TPA: acyl-CoA thioesterase domain-containing protein [Acidimicrobiales bacterium]